MANMGSVQNLEIWCGDYKALKSDFNLQKFK